VRAARAHSREKKKKVNTFKRDERSRGKKPPKIRLVFYGKQNQGKVFFLSFLFLQILHFLLSCILFFFKKTTFSSKTVWKKRKKPFF